MKLKRHVQGHCLESSTVTTRAAAESQQEATSISVTDLTSAYVLTAISHILRVSFVFLWVVPHLQVNELKESILLFKDKDVYCIAVHLMAS